MDYMAIVSVGTYPAPASTSTQRAAFAASWGLLSTAASGVGGIRRLMKLIGSCFKKFIG